MKKISYYLLITAVSVLSSCSKKGDVPKPPMPPSGSKDVYVVGWQTSADGNHSLVKLWKNGVATTLNEVTSVNDAAVANSVYVSGNDVYVTFNENGIPKLWKNGIATALSDGSKQVTVTSVSVHDTDVYLGGQEGNAYYNFAKLWKNGVVQTIATGFAAVRTDQSLVYTSGNDVYVLFQTTDQSDFRFTELWKNGVVTKPLVTPNSYAQAGSIFVSGIDVYIGGFTSDGAGNNIKYFATIWKNGVATPLTDSSVNYAVINSVFVSGVDVYAVGVKRNSANNYPVATLWKNGVATALTNGTTPAYAYTVFVSNTDVYVAGGESTTSAYASAIAKLWKNGVAVDLADGTRLGEALAVFVK